MTEPAPQAPKFQAPAEPGPLGRRILERLLEGTLMAPIARWAHRRVRRDPTWGAAYHALRQAEVAASGAAVSHGQRELLRQLILEPGAAPTEHAAGEPEATPRRTGALLGGSALALAAAAAVLIVALPQGAPVFGPGPGESGGSAEWTSRGDAADARLGVKVRCLSTNGKELLAKAEGGLGARVEGPALRCPTDGILAFSATNLGEERAWLFVVGLGEDGGLRFYAPFDEGSRSALVPPQAADRLLDAAAGLASMPVEEVRLFALFTDEPVDAARIEAALEQARRRGLDPRSLPGLPLPARAQARIDLEVTSRPAR